MTSHDWDAKSATLHERPDGSIGLCRLPQAVDPEALVGCSSSDHKDVLGVMGFVVVMVSYCKPSLLTSLPHLYPGWIPSCKGIQVQHLI